MGGIMCECILREYKAGETSLRRVADLCETNHHKVKRVLIEHGVEIVKAKRQPLTKIHKERISKSTKGRSSWIKGKNATPEMIYKNMAAHLRFDVEWKWLAQFGDVEKLKTLNDCITNRSGRFDVDTDWYKRYIVKFWSCEKFNRIYSRWIESGREHLKKPSIDHIHPRSKNGCENLDNLQFLSWFENRCKNNMPQDEWDSVKNNISEYFI
jgi:hypothetical protein